MIFDLTIHGETAADLLAVLQQLNMTNTPCTQSAAEPATKSKAPAPAKQKKAAQKPTTAPVEPEAEPEPEHLQDWTTNTASGVVPERPTPTPASAPDGPQASTPAQTVRSEATATAPSSDAAAKEKIRDLARSLIAAGRSADVKAVVVATGAKSISTIPPERYTEVWEKLVALSREVDADAAD